MDKFSNVLKALTRGCGGVSPSCQEAARLQSAALDGKLSALERVGLRVHLLLCKWCRAYGKQIEFLRTAARKTAADERGSSATLSPTARERIKQALQSAKNE